MKARLLAMLAGVAVVLALMAATWAGASPLATFNAPAPAVPTDTLTLIAQQDSWVNEGAPGTNYGAEPDLHVGRVSDQRLSYNRETLVQFELAGLPADATISSARLELFQIDAQGAERYTISPYAIFDPWDELKVVWGNKPSAFSLGDPASTLDIAGGWKTWDVTNIVQNWAVGEIQNYGILLLGDGDTLGLRVFSSRDNQQLPDMMPRLVIEYSLPDTFSLKREMALK